jgi:hypothetical protein
MALGVLGLLYLGRGRSVVGVALLVLCIGLDVSIFMCMGLGCLPWDWHRCREQDHSEQREQVHRDGKTLAHSNVKVFFDGMALTLRPSVSEGAM